MTATKKVTVADVRASFNSEFKDHPAITYFGRPLANLITPYFHNTGWTANKMTIARSYIAFAGVSLLAVPIPLLWPVSAAIFIVTFVLDFVDGNLARLQYDATYFGKFIDGLANGVYQQTAPFFLGIGTWLYYDDPRLIILGASISTVSFANHMVRSRLSFFREWMVGLSGDITKEELENARKPRALQHLLSLIVINGYFVAVVALLVPYWGAWLYLIVSVLTQLLPEMLWMATSFWEAGALLKRGRISKHAAIAASAERRQ
jgi:phosphatidylglycerophosphate synthase